MTPERAADFEFATAWLRRRLEQALFERRDVAEDYHGELSEPVVAAALAVFVRLR